jgi:uncharacterized protein DUF1854
MDSTSIRLYREPDWVLNMSVGGHQYSNIVVVRAAPLTSPDQYICFLDANGHEICMIENPSGLDTNSRTILREELDRRYLTSEIHRIYAVRREAGACYFNVETNRGRREFVVQETPESIRWLSEHRLLLVDIDGNRFGARDIRGLDRRSARLLMAMV